MINIYLAANGCNDLYSPMADSINAITRLCQKESGVKLYIFYKQFECNPLNIWKKTREINENEYCNSEGGYLFSGGIRSIIAAERFYREASYENKKFSIMAPDIFINNCQKNESVNDKTILIISGHGGPFQSLLDMSSSPSVSLNTVKLCRRLKKVKIDLLFLDMCAMNYLEVLYELISEGNIKNIVTYKNLAPFYGVDYVEFMNKIINEGLTEIDFHDFYNINSAPLILIKSSSLKDFEKIKQLQSEIVKEMVSVKRPVFDDKIKLIYKTLNDIAVLNKEAEKVKTLPINFIRYRLADENEQKLYNQFGFMKDNLWKYIVTGKLEVDDGYNPEYIVLDKESLENIVYLHNSSLKEDELNILLEKLIKARGEEKIYK